MPYDRDADRPARPLPEGGIPLIQLVLSGALRVNAPDGAPPDPPRDG